MTKAYVYKDNTFDYWRNTTNLHTDQIGDIDQKKSNSSQVSSYLDQQYLLDHENVLNESVSSQTIGATVTLSGTNGYKLRVGMGVSAFVSEYKVSNDLCSITSIVYSGSGVVITLSHALSFSPTPNIVVFNFYVNLTSAINDLEIKKLNRDGDRMTEALVIDSITSNLGELKTNEVNFNIVNETATNVNIAGSATTLVVGAASGNASIRNSNITLGQTASGTTAVNSPIVNISTGSTGVTTIVSTKTSATSSDGSFVVNGGVGLKGNLNVAGAVKIELTTDNTLGSLDGSAQLLGGASVAKNLTIGQDLRIKGSDITIEGNPTITSVTAGNAVGLFSTSTGSIQIGAGNTTSLTANGNVTLATDSTNSVAINASSITTPRATIALLNTVATTVNAFGFADTVNIGSGSSTSNFAGHLNLATAKEFKINGVSKLTTDTLGSTVLNSSLTSVGVLTILDIAGNTNVRNGVLLTNATTANLFNTTATTLNIGGAATAISIGASTGNTTINNTLVVSSLDFGSVKNIQFLPTAVTTTSDTVLFTLDKTIYRSAEVIIQATQGTAYSITKFIMMHDGTDSIESEFGSLGTPFGTFNSSISINNWNMSVIQSSSTSTTYKIFVTAIKV